MSAAPDRRVEAGIDLSARLARIEAAADLIRASARHTPTVYSYTISEGAGCDVWLKLENLQRTGSFKIRGALNKIATLAPEERERGLVAASAGNHAQGVALAARMCGVAATIVMPESTPLLKIQRTEGYGGKVELHGRTWDESQARALALAQEHGWTLVHPFDDPAVIEGQGTVGLEILDEVPEVEAVVVPVGGGGLVSGIALAVKARAPHVQVIGVQAAGADPMVRSFHAGERLRVESPDTIAEGIRVGSTGEHTFAIVRALVDECVTVDEDEIVEAVVQTMEKSKVVAETAGVVAIAALIAGKVPAATSGGKVCAVVSGGNVDLNHLARIIESGLAAKGRLQLLELRLADEPGALLGVLEVLAETRCNVIDVQHYRAGFKVPVGKVIVEFLVETRHAEHGEEVRAALRARGFGLSDG